MSNEMTITFPGGRRVNVKYGDFEIQTDQSVKSGGEASAPEPFDLFLASIGTCVGSYVVGFCMAREISTAGMAITQRWERDESRTISKVILELKLPAGFPEKYRTSVVRAAGSCAVKRTIAAQPEIVIETVA